MVTKIYKINGMHCASCVALIEDKLKKVSGIKNVSVKLSSEKASIDFLNEEIPLSVLNGAISAFGYNLDDVKKESVFKDTQKTESDSRKNMPFNMKVVLFMVFVSFLMMVWQIFADNGFVKEMSENVSTFFHHLMPIFASFVLFGIGRKYLKAVWIFLKTGTANMDTLVGISTSVAFTYSFVITAFEKILAPYLQNSFNFYDVVIVVIGLISFGQYLESKAKKKTNEALQKLASLGSKNAIVIRQGKEINLPIEKIEVDDEIIVKPNERIPLDGIITYGTSSVDESNLTGESIPVDKEIGHTVFAGTLNFQGILHIKITKNSDDTVLSHIISIVENAQNSKAPVEKMADKISGIFVYIVLIFSVATFFSWIIFGAESLGMIKAFVSALSAGMAVLVIACPCSLGLATPTAIIAGVGRGAENGILIKNAESLEKLSKIGAIVFDKTGTLTENKLTVEDIYFSKNIAPDEDYKNLYKSLIYSMTKSSRHPVSESVAKWLKEKEIKNFQIKNFREIAGKGIVSQYENNTYYLGSLLFVSEVTGKNMDEIKKYFDGSHLEDGRELYFSNSTEVLSLIKVHDTIKLEAKEEIAKLKKLGLKVVMATGDHEKTSHNVASDLGIDHVFSHVKPEDKLNIIKDLQSEGLKVLMIGDGVNDAPALAGADVALSVSDGSDIAIESSDIILLKGDIRKVVEAIVLAKKTNRIIWQNLISSFAYNSIGLPVAGGILYPFFGWILSPAIAGSIMAFESLTVVLNSLRIKKI